MKKVFRIDLSYDGTNFLGFQSQKDDTKRTVQLELEKALSLLFKEPITIFAAGRTDTKVHAMHQVISFKSALTIPLEGLKKALNSLLPKDIRILSVSQESPSFHARFSPKKRAYLYILQSSTPCFPFEANYSWEVPFYFSLKKLNQALRYLRGTHNFIAFCEKPSTENTIRTIYKTKAYKKGDHIYIYIEGNAFLRRMIRIIVGSCLQIAAKNLSPKMIQELLTKKHRRENPFPTAPPQGLYFYRVTF